MTTTATRFLLVLGCLAGCKGKDSAPAATPPPAPVTADAAPITADAAPPAGAACLPAKVVPELRMVGDDPLLCWAADGSPGPATDCLKIAGGKVEKAPLPAAPPEYPKATVTDSTGGEPEEAGSILEVCTAAGACKKLEPSGGKDALRLADVDPSGKLAAVVIQEDPLGGGEVAVFDVASGAELARQKFADDNEDGHGQAYWVRFVGDKLLVVDQSRGASDATGTLYALAGKKLKKVSAPIANTYEVAVLGKELYVAGGIASLEVFDLASGKQVRVADLPGFLVGVAEAEEIQGDPGAILLQAGKSSVVAAVALEKVARVAVLPASGPAVLTVIDRCK